MSLPEFATLLAKNPDEDAPAISKLEDVIVRSLLRDKNASFDLTFVLHHLRPAHATTEKAKHLLVQLVKEQALRPLLFWECPNGNNPIFETLDITEFPEYIECDRCNPTRVHWFDVANVEVRFVATDHLPGEVAESNRSVPEATALAHVERFPVS